MRRKAVLLGSTETGLPGSTTADMNNIYSFLLSNEGGAWRPDEVDFLCNAPRNAVYNAINAARENVPDYYFFYWTGHGAFNTVHNDILIQIESSAEFLGKDFEVKSPVSVMIFDTCACIDSTKKIQSLAKAALEEFSTKDPLRDLYRNEFDEALSVIQPMALRYYSSTIGTPSYTLRDNLGSLFTYSLIQSAKKWIIDREQNSKVRTVGGATFLSPQFATIGNLFISASKKCSEVTKTNKDGPQIPDSDSKILTRLTPPFAMTLG